MVCNYPVLDSFPAPNDEEREISMCCSGARVDYSRGIVEMIECAQNTDVPLHLFGVMHDAVEREVERRDKKHLIRVHGFVDPEDVRDQMYRSLIGMVVEYPTGNAVNAYCVKMFEYMASGMAVVSSDIPLWRTTVEETGCGLCVDPKDIGAVTEAVRFLTEHPEKAREMGRSGRRWAEEKYNWAHEEQKLLALYRELVK